MHIGLSRYSRYLKTFFGILSILLAVICIMLGLAILYSAVYHLLFPQVTFLWEKGYLTQFFEQLTYHQLLFCSLLCEIKLVCLLWFCLKVRKFAARASARAEKESSMPYDNVSKTFLGLYLYLLIPVYPLESLNISTVILVVMAASAVHLLSLLVRESSKEE